MLPWRFLGDTGVLPWRFPVRNPPQPVFWTGHHLLLAYSEHRESTGAVSPGALLRRDSADQASSAALLAPIASRAAQIARRFAVTVAVGR